MTLIIFGSLTLVKVRAQRSKHLARMTLFAIITGLIYPNLTIPCKGTGSGPYPYEFSNRQRNAEPLSHADAISGSG